MVTTLNFWQVDAFTNQPFKGNPAAVFVLHQELSDELMQNIAIEMNLSETAFILIRKSQNPLLRWFTPMFEIDLCGHATLASAHIFMTEIYPEKDEIIFDTKFVGTLKVKKIGLGYQMDFPSRLGEKQEIDNIPNYVLDALTTKARPHTAYKSRDLMLVYDDEQIIHTMVPDFNALNKYNDFIIVTAKSSDSRFDFISRFFCADDGIAEDPVTGSAHCTLGPYWSQHLGENDLKAYQASKRGGQIGLAIKENRVLITGEAVTVISGKMMV
jgi:PhzF family phenazine biosynthesis protein